MTFQPPQAVVEFDESQVSVQQVAQAFSASPPMMGRGYQYSATLVLQVEDTSDDRAAEQSAAANC